MTRRHEYHGMTGTVEYRTWVGIKNRCYNPNNSKYKDYMGRGIKVCERWLKSFANFYEDMGDRPSSTYSIDRVDNDGDYAPDNCKWSTPKEQADNRRCRPSMMGEPYVHSNGNNYVVRIRRKSYGTYKTIEEAVAVRDRVLTGGNDEQT